MLATYSGLPNLAVIFFFLFRVVPIFPNSKQLLGSFYLQNPQTDVILPLPWLTKKLLSGNLLFFPEPALVWYFYLRRSSCKSVLMKTLSCYIRSSCHADPSLGCAVCSLAVTVNPSRHPHTWVSLQGWHWELWLLWPSVQKEMWKIQVTSVILPLWVCVVSWALIAQLKTCFANALQSTFSKTLVLWVLSLFLSYFAFCRLCWGHDACLTVACDQLYLHSSFYTDSGTVQGADGHQQTQPQRLCRK